MKQILFGICVVMMSCVFAEEPVAATTQISINNGSETKATEIVVRVEALPEIVTKSGLTVADVQAIITQALTDAHIVVSENSTKPTLVLRVRSIQVGLDVASFFQLGFYEDAMLARNRSLFQAMTWSQASLLACRPEEVKKEVSDTVAQVAKTFAQDLNSAIRN